MISQTLSINRGRLSVLVALVILSFSLLPLIEVPAAGGLSTSFLGTPLRLEFTAGTIVLVLVTVLTCAGVDALLREHSRVRRGEVSHLFSYWLIPALTVVAASQVLGSIKDSTLWILGLIVTAVVLWLTILAEYAAIDPEGPAASRSRLFLTAMAYILATLLFGLIWYTRARSSLSATLTFAVAAGLAFDLLYASHAKLNRVLTLTFSIALILAEANWAVNYWRSNVFVAAVAQLLAFYALVGLAGQHLIDRVNRRVLVEFAAVLALAILLLLWGHL